jgi:aldehyde:ferredoxin oxidoreductase
MGSKNLKAIACKGTIKINVAKPDEFREAAKERFDWVNQSMLKMTLEVYGTNTMLDMVNIKGGLPSRNWQTGDYPEAESINGEALNEKVLVETKPCFACPIACGRVSKVKEGPYKSEGEGPEYESIGAFGSMCDINNMEAITLAHFLSNEFGIDTISAGSTIAFAMECYEKGILTKEDTGGIEIKFGDPDAIVKLVPMIGKREGIGDLLAEGTKIMSEKLGQGSEKFAMHVKGLELPAYDSRAAKITGLAYATANRGGDHITAYIEGPAFLSMPFLIVEDGETGDPLSEEDAVKATGVVKDFEDAFGIFDAIGGCKFMGMVLTAEDWADMIGKLMNYEYTASEFRKTGERLYNLERMYNIREGLTRADDSLPKRLTEDPLPDGPAEGHVVNLDPMLDSYYEARGWDVETGVPSPDKLKELGLDWIFEKM